MTANIILSNIHRELTAHQEDYLERHPHDWDCCGFANIVIEFGRKTKAKKYLESLGIFDMYKTTRYGKTVFYVTLLGKYRDQMPRLGHQSLTYKEEQVMTMIKVLRDIPELQGINMYMVSSMD